MMEFVVSNVSRREAEGRRPVLPVLPWLVLVLVLVCLRLGTSLRQIQNI